MPMFSLTLITAAFSVVSETVSLACEETKFRDMEQGLVWKTLVGRNTNSNYKKKKKNRNKEPGEFQGR